MRQTKSSRGNLPFVKLAGEEQRERARVTEDWQEGGGGMGRSENIKLLRRGWNPGRRDVCSADVGSFTRSGNVCWEFDPPLDWTLLLESNRSWFSACRTSYTSVRPKSHKSLDLNLQSGMFLLRRITVHCEPLRSHQGTVNAERDD